MNVKGTASQLISETLTIHLPLMFYHCVVSVLPWGSWFNHMAETHYAQKIEDLMDIVFVHPLHPRQGTAKHHSLTFKPHWNSRLYIVDHGNI